MQDDNDARAIPESTAPAPEPPNSESGVEPTERVQTKLNRPFGGRQPVVYFALIAGGATLLILLAIVWLSATGDDPEDLPICTPIGAEEARQIIFSGETERITVLVDQEDPLNSLTGMRLDLLNGACRQPTQGADARADLYYILGAAELYNTFGEQRVKVSFQRQQIDSSLLSTSTPTPTATLPIIETPTVEATSTPTLEPATPEPTLTETPTPTIEPTETATVEPTATAEPTETRMPELAPDASPNASPERTLTATATRTPTP